MEWVFNEMEWAFECIIDEYKITCTWNKVIESSSIWTRTPNFLDPRLIVDAEPSTPDGVLIECVIRLPDAEACDGAILCFAVPLTDRVYVFVCLNLKRADQIVGCFVNP